MSHLCAACFDSGCKARLKALGDTLPVKSAYLIEDPLNLKYFTGTDIDTGVLLITHAGAYFLTDFRYIESANKHFAGSEVEPVLLNNRAKDIADILSGCGSSALGIEAEYQTVSRLEALKKHWDNVICDGELDRTISELRSSKSDAEIALIKSAQKLTDSAFTHILPFIKPGVKERDIALEIEFFMRKNGASGVSFDLITITGKKTSLPHGIPSEDTVKSGDFFTMDIGCKFGGYCSDMTRTVAVGSADDEMRRVYDTVLRAQKATLSILKAGVSCADADKAARDVIAAAGYGSCFGHATGHSVGLYIHESPALSPKSTAILQSGEVVTVEPGIYLENRFGVRIEDMVVIRDGGIENLTKSDKELIVL